MRAEIAIRNVAGIFSGKCPHCSEPVLSDVCCGDEFSCVHCSGNIEIRNYGSTFLFLRAPVKVSSRKPRGPRMIDPETYCDY